MKKILFTFFLFLFLSSILLAQTVYVTKTGSKYHKAGCSYLKSVIEMSLEDAVAGGYTACSRCNPPALKSTNENSSSEQKIVPKSKTSSSGRCQATTKKGTQCKRNAKAGSKYCWQHQK